MNKQQFVEELKKINIEITHEQLEKLEKYYELLVETNKKINLTGITDKEQVYLKHFYDSATLNKIINIQNEKSLCDIGTGAGFPGIVLKILFPKLKVTLVDSLNKRIEFLKLVINQLGLKDIEALHYRIEEYGIKNREKFDIVTARAVAPLNILCEYSIPLVKVNKFFIAMKANISQEIEESKRALEKLNSTIDDINEFLLPIENSSRSLIKIKKNNLTNSKYPRKYSDIKNKSL